MTDPALAERLAILNSVRYIQDGGSSTYQSAARKGRLMVRVLAALVAMVLVTGCATKPKEPEVSKQEVVRMALAYLKNKYGTSFELYWVNWGGQWDSGLRWNGPDTWLAAYPTGGTRERAFRVNVDPSTSPISFHDCYVAALMGSAYQKRAEAALKTVRREAVVVAVPESDTCESATPDTWTTARPFDEFKAWADQNLSVAFCLYVPLAAERNREYALTQLPAYTRAFKQVAGSGSVQLRGYDPKIFRTQVVPRQRPSTTGRDCILTDEAKRPAIKTVVSAGWRPQR